MKAHLQSLARCESSVFLQEARLTNAAHLQTATDAPKHTSFASRMLRLGSLWFSDHWQCAHQKRPAININPLAGFMKAGLFVVPCHRNYTSRHLCFPVIFKVCCRFFKIVFLLIVLIGRRCCCRMSRSLRANHLMDDCLEISSRVNSNGVLRHPSAFLCALF